MHMWTLLTIKHQVNVTMNLNVGRSQVIGRGKFLCMLLQNGKDLKPIMGVNLLSFLGRIIHIYKVPSKYIRKLPILLYIKIINFDGSKCHLILNCYVIIKTNYLYCYRCWNKLDKRWGNFHSWVVESFAMVFCVPTMEKINQLTNGTSSGFQIL
jgi:hypothetical protein